MSTCHIGMAKTYISLYTNYTVWSGPSLFDCRTIGYCTIWASARQNQKKWNVRSAKTQISLGIRPVWSESSLCAHWVAKDPSFLHADSEDSDQTGRMPRLIRVFAERTCHFVGFVMRWLICECIDPFNIMRLGLQIWLFIVRTWCCSNVNGE